MNAARIAEIERGITAAARKVLDAVPIAEVWTIAQICAELMRRGQNHDRHHVSGCLASLREDGLIKEPKPATFIRVTIRQAVQRDAATAVTPRDLEVAANAAPIDEPDTLTKMATLSLKLRSLAAEISHASVQLDDLAIEVEQRIQAVGKDGEKLRQLKNLLVGL